MGKNASSRSTAAIVQERPSTESTNRVPNPSPSPRIALRREESTSKRKTRFEILVTDDRYYRGYVPTRSPIIVDFSRIDRRRRRSTGLRILRKNFGQIEEREDKEDEARTRRRFV